MNDLVLQKGELFKVAWGWRGSMTALTLILTICINDFDTDVGPRKQPC